jgi:8-oxo-dGTP pyrophosphatase MutT (NUDIX family)
MQEQIARTVGALFIGADDKVLLGLRAPTKKAWPNHWDTIGGHVEDGESLGEALVREAREEVGVTLVPTFRSPRHIAAASFRGLRKVMGTSKSMILVPLSI